MKRATAIIGANFGDEGKGLMTDYHCSRHGAGAIVVRFNGGAQAGHTVQVPGGARHVFHHFGAGAFTGAATYLSRFFIVNPLLWQKELMEMMSVAGMMRPVLFVDRDAPLTTPYDMLINQELEVARGANRHGSCGIGINETIVRVTRGTHATHVRDIENPVMLRSKLLEVRAGIPARFAELGIERPSAAALAVIASDVLVDRFIEVAEEFRTMTSLADAGLLRGCEDVIFEGAQGLLLDELHEFFPYVTRSRTGLHNVLAIAAEAGIGAIGAVYVTRAYMTRHGAGPFPTEDDDLRYEDDTNVMNEYQGTLRFGRLDIDLLAASIRSDLASVGSTIAITPELAITCMDQAGAVIGYRHCGTLCTAPAEEFTAAVFDAVGVEGGYLSHGPTRNDVVTVRRSALRPV